MPSLAKRARLLLEGATHLEILPRDGNFFNQKYIKLPILNDLEDKFFSECFRYAKWNWGAERLKDDPVTEEDLRYEAIDFYERAYVEVSKGDEERRHMELDVEDLVSLLRKRVKI